MAIHKLRRYFLLALASLLTVSILTACGGGGSSTGGGSVSAGATLSGNVNSGIAMNQPESSAVRFMLTMLELAVSDAQAAGIAGLVVELYLDGTLIDSQTIGADGEFMFTGLQPGNYTVKISQGGQTVGESSPIRLEANTRTRIDIGVSGVIGKVEVKAAQNTIKGEVDTEDMSEDNSTDSHDDDMNDDHQSDMDSDSDMEKNDDSSDDSSDDSDNHMDDSEDEKCDRDPASGDCKEDS